MDAAIVELDALADADRARADDDGPAAGHDLGFVLLLIGAVEIGGLGGEFGGAGVNHLVDGPKAPVLAKVADLLREAVGQGADVVVGEAEALGGAHEGGCKGLLEETALHVDQVVELVGEPGIDAGAAGEALGAEAPAEGGHEGPDPLVVGLRRDGAVFVAGPGAVLP